jgi:O-antigen/teichoic acid export membrane protein
MTNKDSHKPQKTLAEKTVWSAGANLSSILGKFLAGIIIARILGPNGMGKVAYLLWIVEFVNTLANFGLQNSLSRFLAETIGAQKDHLASTLAHWIYIRYIALALMGTLSLLLYHKISNLASYSQSLWFLVCLIFFIQGLASIYQSYLIGRQRFDISAKINVISSLLMVFIVAIGTKILGIWGTLIGYLAGYILPASLSISLFKKNPIEKTIDKSLKNRIWKYAFNTWIAAIVSAFVWSRMEIFFIEHYWNSHEVAMFTIGLTLASIFSQGPLLLGSALLPYFAECTGANNFLKIKWVYASATRITASILFPICFIGAAITPVLLPFLYGSSFIPAVPISMILIALASLGFANVGSTLIYGVERSGFIAASGLIGAMMAVITNLIMVPYWGVMGAVLSRGFVQCSMIALGTWFIASRLKCPVPFRELGKMLIASILSSMTAYLLILFHKRIFMLFISIPAGLLVYLIAIRYLKVIYDEDLRPFYHILNRFPKIFRNPCKNILIWISPKVTL